MQRWTNDTFRSTVHRVVTPDDPQSASKDRYSIALFCHPDDEVTIECLDAFKRSVDGSLAVKYPPISALSYLLERLQKTYRVEAIGKD